VSEKSNPPSTVLASYYCVMAITIPLREFHQKKLSWAQSIAFFIQMPISCNIEKH
jgi:hypothetical protein